MADDADLANDHTEQELAMRLARQREFTTPEGRPGDCDFCGEWSGRLVAGACAPCRDRRGLP